MPGKAAAFITHTLIACVLHASVASAHSLAEIDRLFEDEPIPPELIELTKNLDMTAGAKSIREHAHDKQHELLERYIQARMERRCTDALESITRLDLEIASLQEREHHEEEQARRKVRDDTAAFIKSSCPSKPTNQ
jgi:hypothetical protein